MDNDFFVQKVKQLCLEKGLKPTNVCNDCGVGGSFLPDIKRGRCPSVDKVQKLAAYLGVTTSELLGEKKEPTPKDRDGPSDKDMRLIAWFRSLPPEKRKAILMLGEAPEGLDE